MSSNPLINTKIIENSKEELLDDKKMTIQGTIVKLQISLLSVIISAYFTWNLCVGGYSDKIALLYGTSIIGGLILAITTALKPHLSNITTLPFSICEGILVGAISYSFNSLYDGIVPNALAVTILTMFAMLFLYKSNIIKATPTFKKVVIISTISIAIFYFIAYIGTLIGYNFTLFNGGAVGIIANIAICAIAALNFVLDFDFIEQATNADAPKIYEWYGAFTLLTTLVWLYIEVLKLLAQLSRRD